MKDVRLPPLNKISTACKKTQGPLLPRRHRLWPPPGAASASESGTTRAGHSASGRHAGHPRSQTRRATTAFRSQFQEWMTQEGVAFVSINDVMKSSPSVAPYIAGLDFIVHRDEHKLLVAVRPNLPTKNANAAREAQKLLGRPYLSVRIWQTESADGWSWEGYPIEIVPADGVLPRSRVIPRNRPRPKDGSIGNQPTIDLRRAVLCAVPLRQS